MASDIFISYSRKDSEHALGLAERLRSNGMEVWIDQGGLEGADVWPKEIVQAVWGCKVFIVLLSEASLISKNVLRELSLAVEKKKPILPLKLSAVQLNEDFAYPLAGIQRVAASDFESIRRSLAKLGVGQHDRSHSHERHRSTPPFSQPEDSRTSLIVLPLDDLSPAGEDNIWFADGLAGELIDAFQHIKSLRILDRKTSLGLRGAKLRTAEIGKEFNARYVIDGSVRIFDEHIKISISLLDLVTGDALWQNSYRGEFKDIFDIQESVAQKVAEGLKLHVTQEEKSRIHDRGTENAEAYTLVVKAHEYFERHTQAGFEFATTLASEAVLLDPGYAEAYAFKAEILATRYRTYHADPALLEEGMRLVRDALRLKPDHWDAYRPLSILYQLQGNLEEAETTAKKYIANAPDRSSSHFTLGFFYDSTGQYAKAITAYEQAVIQNPDYLPNVWNLILASNLANESEKRSHWAGIAIPIYERHLKFFPDDEFNRACYASVLHFAGRDEEARAASRQLAGIRDGTSLYSLACLNCELGDYEDGLRTFYKAVEAGYRNMTLLNRFLISEDAGIAKLKGTPNFEGVKQMVEKIEADAKNYV